MRLDVEPLKALLVKVAACRAGVAGLQDIVRTLADQPYIALARFWLLAPGDVCSSCRMRPECPDQSQCLHLVASAGTPLGDGDDAADWSRTDGAFRRFPVGVRKIGHIAATGEAVEVRRIADGDKWIARPDFVKSQGIVGLAGQPLVHQGETLGVLAVFTRVELEGELLFWLRMLADHAAAATANARAFEEIERLRYRLELENRYLREEVKAANEFGEIVGQSSALSKALEQIALVAPTDASVLIFGESGTGKELIARAIHERSARSDAALVKVNCASVPKELFESEFFGHVRGAFTGAVADREGRFALADGGTLFLDEVGEIPKDLQGKLLRVLQEGTFERVGDSVTRRVDVRIVAASNRDLKEDAETGAFRQDLYYRLSVFPVDVPPLRARLEDVPLLAEHFLEHSCRRLGIPAPTLKRRHVLELQGYDWPGNVRELQNVIERAAIRSLGGPLEFGLPRTARAPTTPRPASPDGDHLGVVLTYDELRQRERENLVAALERAGQRVSGPGGAAELLGVKPTTLASRMKAMGIQRRR